VKRPLPFLAALLAGVLLGSAVLTGCGAGSDPQAATIGSTSISRADLEDELRVLGENEAFVNGLKQQQNIEIVPLANTVLPDISSQWLNLLVNQSIIDREYEERGLSVSPQQEQQAKAQAEQTFGGAEVFAEFPQWFQQTMIDRQGRVIALQADLPGFEPSDADLQEYFDENMAASCITNQLVSHILVPTEADATAIKALLDSGSDFAEVAEQRSTDTASAQNGGKLFCTASQEFVNIDQAFKDAVVATPTGTISAPFQTQFGWHIVQVAPWTFENVRPIVAAQYAQQVENPLTRLLNRELRRSDVWVDPRYGRAVETGGTVVIQPPAAPQVREKPPAPTAGLPTPAP
jgi:foldase protein PrsA